MVRCTTSGVLKGYRFNLQRSTHTLNQSRDTVLTGRNFNSFADDPATASKSFKLRNSLLRSDAQRAIGESVVHKYEVAWSTLSTISDQVDNARSAIQYAATDTTGQGRKALGEELCKIADGMAHAMNTKYGDSYVFAGADGQNAPFTFDGNTLSYRGVDVKSENDPRLNYMVTQEKKYVDLGLGLEEDDNQQLNTTSAYDISLQGIDFLGYGVETTPDGEKVPNNLICIINDIGQILKNCDNNGNFASEAEEQAFGRLSAKFTDAAATLTNKYTELDTEASFLKQNQKQLESTCYTLQEQIVDLENVDPADAITSYSWAQYCYNAALKVGNSILSESLMDYIRT